MQLWTVIRNKYFITGCLLICLGFPLFEVSPAFMSAGTIICALGLFNGNTGTNLKKLASPPALLFIILWVWILIGGLYSADTKNWWSICSRKLPLLLLPVGFASVSLTKKQVWGVLLFFNAVITVFSVASTLYYFSHFDAINASLIESKSVPVWPVKKGISHIYFGVLMSFSIVNSLYFLLNEKQTVVFTRDRLVFGSLGLLNFVIIHLLSARTGLVALYGGLGVLVLHTVWQYRRIKMVWLALIILPLIPVIAYAVLPSFRNKIINSVTDIQINRSGGDINHRSFSMRVEAWKTGIDIIENHPLTGVGPGDLSHEMAVQYDKNQSVLWPENRVMPHNQFIENGVQLGLPYILFLLLVVWWPLIKWKQTHPLQWAVSALFFFAMCFESILERQIGVTLFPFALFLTGYLGGRQGE